jgi:hypothetical protein
MAARPQVKGLTFDRLRATIGATVGANGRKTCQPVKCKIKQIYSSLHAL